MGDVRLRAVYRTISFEILYTTNVRDNATNQHNE